MPDALLTLVLGLAVFGAVYGVARWAARMETRDHERRLLGRLYYPKRGSKVDLQVLVRRQGQPCGSDRAPSDD